MTDKVLREFLAGGFTATISHEENKYCVVLERQAPNDIKIRFEGDHLAMALLEAREWYIDTML